ncbi:hypothetical protein H5410_043701 [Solanum commersonii]|uniref:Uncharacterized protein n=1 Tax=Solanum commersonii TaxID=4109 RepID=A0A9J5XXW7_SOLCO|nr:hypothetical protein H5410_043701 [Solanum commersonii]
MEATGGGSQGRPQSFYQDNQMLQKEFEERDMGMCETLSLETKLPPDGYTMAFYIHWELDSSLTTSQEHCTASPGMTDGKK